MNWKKLLESASESVNDQLRLRHDYLVVENRILRNQINGRMQLTDCERKELAELGAKLDKKALEEIATIAKPDTILAWNRTFADQQVDTSELPESVGRPRADKEIENVVLRMARENRSWGYDRLQGALKHLGYTISDQTVGHILKRHGLVPAPERNKTVTWREFVRIHLDLLLATDFFNGEVWSWFGLMLSSLLWCVHVVHCRTHAVVRVLQHHLQGLSSLVIRCLDVSAHVDRWMPVVKKCFRLQERRGGEAILETTISARVPCDEGQAQFQDRGKVVVLSNIFPRPIRDGPTRSRQQRGDLFRDVEREAA